MLKKLVVFITVIISSLNVLAEENFQNETAPEIRSTFEFKGETSANKGLFGEVLNYIVENRQDKACESVEIVSAKPLPLVVMGDMPKRHKPEFVKDDEFEVWDVTMCGKSSTYFIKFAYKTEKDVLYWVKPLALKSN
jgi:hypothetical protein